MLQQLILNSRQLKLAATTKFAEQEKSAWKGFSSGCLAGILSIRQSNMKNHLLVSSENKKNMTTLNKTLGGELKE